jgi:hypothetical protein
MSFTSHRPVGLGGLMNSLKRTLQICILSTLTLSTMKVFAEGVAAAPSDNAVVSSSQAKPETPSVKEGINLRDLGIQEPVNRNCTASATCSLLGGTPIMCIGNSSCTSTISWIRCDMATPIYCTCNPTNIINCRNPQGFCECWSASPSNGFGPCRQAYCI